MHLELISLLFKL